MSPREIMKLPYIQFVIGMLDAPSIDYENRKVKKEETKPATADQQVAAIMSALG